MECPNCKTESDGRYCPSCGVPLSGATCRVCGAPHIAGAGFCTQCGEPVLQRASSNVPWYIAGAAIVALIVVLIWPTLDRSPASFAAAPTAAAPFAGTTGGGSPPPLTGTPREQADRLFNRIMEERSAGNMEQAAFFLPMALTAYQQARPLDADGLYHLSMLQTAAGDFDGALATAREILGMAPDHLLGLAAAADAATELGDSTGARAYWMRYIEVFDVEKDKTIQEYLDHARILPQYLETARGVVG